MYILKCLDIIWEHSNTPTYGTYISQVIRYSRACHNYDNFSSRHFTLAERLFNQGFSARKLIRTLYKFMSRYPELVSKFNKSPSPMICAGVLMAQLYHTFPQLTLRRPGGSKRPPVVFLKYFLKYIKNFA